MADKSMKFTLDFAAKTGQLRDAASEVEKLSVELDGGESAAKDLADAMRRAADDMETDMRETAAVADRLGVALGPELAAKIGQANLETMSAKLRGVGLDADMSEADVDELADGIRRLDGAADAARRTGDDVKRIGTEADQSRSVMANLAGNAMSELPGVSAALGPVNMALGQLTEYATEGNIKIGSLAKMAGPMLGVGVAISVISKHMDQVAKSKAFHKERIDAFTEALQKGVTAAEAWDAALTKEKKVEFVDAATGDISDLTDELYNSGVTWENFTTHLNGSKEDFESWARATFGARAEQGDLNHVLQAGWQLMDDQAASTKRAREEAYVFGKGTKEVTGVVKHNTSTIREQKDALNGVATAAAEADREFAALKGEIDDDQAWLDMLDTLDEYKATMGDAEASDRDKVRSGLAVQEELIGRLEAIKNLPAEKQTEILTLIDQGAFDEAAMQIGILTEARRVKINFDVGNMPSLVGSKYASGTSSAAPGVALVGEEGPELVMMRGGETVIPAGQTANALSSGGGSATYNVTVNGANMSADQLVAAIKAWERRNGPGWRQ